MAALTACIDGLQAALDAVPADDDPECAPPSKKQKLAHAKYERFLESMSETEFCLYIHGCAVRGWHRGQQVMAHGWL